MHVVARLSRTDLVRALHDHGSREGLVGPTNETGWTAADVLVEAGTGPLDPVATLAALDRLLPAPWFGVLDEGDDHLAPGVAAVIGVRTDERTDPVLGTWRRDRPGSPAVIEGDHDGVTAPVLAALAAAGMPARDAAALTSLDPSPAMEQLARAGVPLPAWQRPPDRLVDVVRADIDRVREIVRHSVDTTLLLRVDERTTIMTVDPDAPRALAPTGPEDIASGALARALGRDAVVLVLSRGADAPPEQTATAWATGGEAEDLFGSWDARWTALDTPPLRTRADAEAAAEHFSARLGPLPDTEAVLSALTAGPEDTGAPQRLLEGLGLPVETLAALDVDPSPFTSRAERVAPVPRDVRDEFPQVRAAERVTRVPLRRIIALSVVMVVVLAGMIVSDRMDLGIPNALGYGIVLVAGLVLLRPRRRSRT